MNKLEIDISKLNFANFQIKPENYILTEELKNAVKVAISLGQPLLLTGEPGTGKTQLAYKIAHDLSKGSSSFNTEPLVFNTKTTSVAADLFYTYDAIKHFHDANIRNAENIIIPKISKYITLQAFGKAIALSNQNEVQTNEFLVTAEKKTASSVVLIDEIDKAPRDFPNDILNEIERFEFEIKEADNYKIKIGDKHHIVVIMTSNSEKNLPDAFLRRCIFYHIPFPSKEQLINIVKSHLGENSFYSDEKCIDFFIKVRETIKKKKPATAELIAWLRILEIENFVADNKFDFKDLTPVQKNILQLSYSVLAKTKDDLLELNNL